MASKVQIGSARQLFLDNHVIDSVERVQRRCHRPTRELNHPVISADTPLEKNGNGPFLFGGTVIFDEEDHIFKMWYRHTDILEKAPEGMRDVIAEDGTISRRSWIDKPGLFKALYATSKDGIHWEKPNLGIVEHNGSKNNNILPSGTGGKDILRRPALIKDYEEPDPSKKYKMAYVDQVQGQWSLEQAYSKDGVNWHMGAGAPAHFEQPIVPHGAFFGWDPLNKLWVHFSKKLGKRRLDIDGRMTGGLQSICRSTSPDFEHWGNTEEVITPQDSDPQFWSPGSHAILSAMLYTDDLFIGISDTTPARSSEDVPPGLEDVIGSHDPGHFSELFYSRDGIQWHRAAPFFEFLPPGLWGTWDSELVICSKPMVHNNEIYFYYSGNNLKCDAHIPDHPQNHLLRTNVNGIKSGYGIGLAKMRLDGFVSIDGYDDGGTLTTKPLIFEGDRLVVNVRAPEKAHTDVINPVTPFGSLDVELLTENGEVLAEYSKADCDTYTGDNIQHTVTWNANSNVGQLVGKPVRIRFYLKNTALYSFHFREERAPQNLSNPGEPGSRGWPY